MALFAKNKPTKRIELEGGWVELQYLSKGVKDEVQNQIVQAFKDIDPKVLQQYEKTGEMPDSLPVEIVAKVNEASYIALAHAIKAWSEKEEVTIESVKDLDEEVFNLLIEEVNKMNKLDIGEKKN
jgi:phosphoribosylformimino-5-aminoimidazole carboxamide ribonucleotide (ProFAR) isomerase